MDQSLSHHFTHDSWYHNVKGKIRIIWASILTARSTVQVVAIQAADDDVGGDKLLLFPVFAVSELSSLAAQATHVSSPGDDDRLLVPYGT
jgi:hypothetical protein